jgi:hypothetical protein
MHCISIIRSLYFKIIISIIIIYIISYTFLTFLGHHTRETKYKMKNI